jgi:hypothetical protein
LRIPTTGDEADGGHEVEGGDAPAVDPEDRGLRQQCRPTKPPEMIYIHRLLEWQAATIVVQKARGPLARHEARIFSTTRPRHGTSYSGPGLSPAR